MRRSKRRVSTAHVLVPGQHKGMAAKLPCIRLSLWLRWIFVKASGYFGVTLHLEPVCEQNGDTVDRVQKSLKGSTITSTSFIVDE